MQGREDQCGMILEVASLTASLPSTYSTVTSSFERQESVNAKAVADAVRDEIVTRRNRGDISMGSSSSANLVKATGVKTRSSSSNAPKTEKVERVKCDYCKKLSQRSVSQEGDG